MKGYLIANLDIHDPQTFQHYREAVGPVIERFGGRYIIRGGEVDHREGGLPIKRLIVLEFPTIDAVRAFYDSPEYEPIKALRLQSATSDVALVTGYEQA